MIIDHVELICNCVFWLSRGMDADSFDHREEYSYVVFWTASEDLKTVLGFMTNFRVEEGKI